MVIARKKTTVYLDPALLRAVKVLAASSGRHDYEIFEEALRRYIGAHPDDVSRLAMRDLLDELRSDSEPTEAEALELAYAELRAARAARRH